jgi:integrase
MGGGHLGSKDEVIDLVARIEPHYRLAACLQYGSGLRRGELVSLRIKDLDLERGLIIIRAGKGDKDRVTIIPQSLIPALTEQILLAKRVYDQDRLANRPGVALPNALGRSDSLAGKRDRHSHPARIAGSCRSRNDANLYPCRFAGQWAWREEPARWHGCLTVK